MQVLQFWCRLQRENHVPVGRQRVVLERAIARLRDKAALVRKAAIQLLKVTTYRFIILSVAVLSELAS